MIIYFIEYRNSVKFFNINNDYTIEIRNKNILNKFIEACKRRQCKLVNMLNGDVLK